jgi:hypothetical protein
MAESGQPDDEIGLGGALFGCGFGAYLLYGAYCSFSGSTWPGFMPPQLDVVAFVFSFISDAASAYVAGAVAALLGAATLAGTVLLVFIASRRAGHRRPDA